MRQRGGAVTLAAIARAIGSGGARIVGDEAVAVRGMTHDSRRVAPGMLFACVPGRSADGHAFAPAAVAAGAAALLVERPLEVDVPQLVVGDSRLAMGAAAAAAYGDPSASLQLVGITGTNGKTTTSHLLVAVLRAAGRTTGVIGTLSGAHTTPEAPELQARLAEFRDDGHEAVVMEVSSHALALHRVDGCRFAVSVFTNLGIDHLDLHGTQEAYFRAKASLFVPELTAIGVTNTDDAHGRLLLDAATIDMVGYGPDDISDVEVGIDHHAYTWRGQRIRVGLGAEFNVWNSLAAATAAAVLGVDAPTIAAGLAAAGAVPGRFERVGERDGVEVLVDFAHTPEGLEQLIRAVRAVAPGRRVVVVFGAGGDRDRTKRPLMGATVVRLADRAVVTSDNPRSERPAAIIDDVLSDVSAAERAKVTVEVDRWAAIATALGEAAPGDVVLVAGRGHERLQDFGDHVVDFDDRAVVRQLLEEPSGHGGERGEPDREAPP